MWLTLALLATLFFAIARTLQKVILLNAKHDPISYAIFFQLVVAACILPVALIDGFAFPPLQDVWLGLFFVALFYCLANIFSYHSLRAIPLSDFAIIGATIPLWTVITSVLFLNESANPIKILGIVLTVSGIMIAFYTRKKLKLDKAHYLAVLAAMCFGFAFTTDAYMLQYFKISTYSFIYWFLPAVVLGLLYPKKLRGMMTFTKDGIIKSLGPSALFAGASLAMNTGYKLGGEISQIATIVQSSIILIIIFGILFLNEKERLVQKLFGGIIVFFGIILVQMT